MEKAFEYVLPSNASSALYPNNTASNYTTVPLNPLQLHGTWEVGVKSIFYNSNIGDQEEAVGVTLNYDRNITTLVSNVYPVNYLMTSENTWNYNWRKVPTFPTKKITSNPVKDSNEFNKAVARTLNTWNQVIVKKDSKSVMRFLPKFPLIYQFNRVYGFSIRLKPMMAEFLGLKDHVFRDMGREYDHINLNQNAPLHVNDFQIMVFDRNVVQRHTRVILKAKDESVLTQTEFIKRWKDRITPHVPATVAFDAQENLIIYMSQLTFALVFNDCLYESINFPEAVFGGGSLQANKPYSPKCRTDYDKVEWIVDIYKDQLKSTTTSKRYNYKNEFYPRQLTIPRLLSTLSETFTQILKQEFDSSEVVKFSFCNPFINVELPTNATIELTPNLVTMLGFEKPILKGPRITSSFKPVTFSKREQEIFIYLDIVDLMNYGTQKQQVLQHFLHSEDGSDGIVERYFDPIIYQPVTKTMTDSLTIQLLDGHHQRLSIKDSKTIVTLHFRKVN